MFQLIILVVLFILLSGLMALIEAAVLSVTRAEVEVLVRDNRRGARTLRRVKGQITRGVVVIVVLTNTVNVLGPVLVGTTAVEIYGDAVIGIVTALLTLGTIVFSEVIPKSLGTHYAPGIAVAVAPVLNALVIVLFPIVWVFERLTGAFKVGERRFGTEDQIRSLVRLGHSAGYIEPDETRLVHRAFQLNDRTAAEIMTPIEDVVVLDRGSAVHEAAHIVVEQPYSRYPVFGPGRCIEGILLSHDLLGALACGNDAEPILNLLRPGLSVDGATRADDLLQFFRDRRFHLAVVTRGNEVLGVVTLEDVLEELVGEIVDEKEDQPRDQSK